MEEFKRILVVSRQTAYCRKAVQYGVSLARQYGAELYFIHCTHDPFHFEWAPAVPVWTVAEDYKRLLVKNREAIDRVIAGEKEKGMKIVELIKEADPVTATMEAVRDESIDLLIMAAHEEGRLEHLLFGHGNEEIVRRIPCSLLLVKTETGEA
jgi:universal stress protein A